MKNSAEILAILSLTALCACGPNTGPAVSAENFSISGDAEALQERVTPTNEEIALVDSSGENLVGILPGFESFLALQVAELEPPTVLGSKLQANDVVIDLLSTYISYNMAGDPYLGAIDVLDITQILNLKILTSLSSSTSEYNGLTKDGNTLYAVGATSTAAAGPAFLQKIALNNGLLTSSITQYTLPSYAGTDVSVTTDKVLATSGDAGGLSIFAKSTMALTKAVSLTDARSVDVLGDGSLVALSGQPGKVTVLTGAGDVSRTISLGGATIAQSKSTLQIGSKWSLAALGDGGMSVFCNSNGAIIENVPQATVSGITAAKTVTNAASSSTGLVFSANGEAGVYVYSLKDLTTGTCGSGKLTYLGRLNFGVGLSANAVFFKNGLLFVVTGTGGLKILTVTYVSIGALSTNL